MCAVTASIYNASNGGACLKSATPHTNFQSKTRKPQGALPPSLTRHRRSTRRSGGGLMVVRCGGGGAAIYHGTASAPTIVVAVAVHANYTTGTAFVPVVELTANKPRERTTATVRISTLQYQIYHMLIELCPCKLLLSRQRHPPQPSCVQLRQLLPAVLE